MSKNDAWFWLKFKVLEYTETCDDLGFMDVEDIRNKILKNKFSKKETILAIREAVKDNILSLYYKIKCPNCTQVNLFKEENIEDKKTKKSLVDKFVCKHCSKTYESINIDDKKFCVDNRHLEYRKPQRKSMNIFKRIKRWIQ